MFTKIGKGKYSEVFDGLNVLSNQNVVIKMLKPNDQKKINREVLVLNRLRGHPNIIELSEVVQDKCCNTYSLVTLRTHMILDIP